MFCSFSQSAVLLELIYLSKTMTKPWRRLLCGRIRSMRRPCHNTTRGDICVCFLTSAKQGCDVFLAQARRPDMDIMVSGGQIVDAIVKLLQDEEAAQAWS